MATSYKVAIALSGGGGEEEEESLIISRTT